MEVSGKKAQGCGAISEDESSASMAKMEGKIEPSRHQGHPIKT